MSAEEGNGIPTSWAELRALHDRDPALVQRNFDHFADQLTRRGVKPIDMGVALAYALEFALDPLLFGADSTARSFFDRLEPPAAAVLKDRTNVMNTLARPRLAALSLCSAADCAGWDLGLEPNMPVLLDKLAGVEQQQEDETRWMVFAMLAFRHLGPVPDLLLVRDLDTPPEPGEAFQFNVHGFQVHLARALSTGSGFDAVAEAWAEYLALYPRLAASDSATMPELFLAARTVHSTIGGGPVEDTLDWLRASIA